MTPLLRRHRILVTALLTLAAIAAGDALGRRRSTPASAARPAADVSRSALTNGALPTPETVPQHEQRLSRTVARCETAALWKWLVEFPPGEPSEFKGFVMNELYARLGAQAFEQSLKIDNPGTRLELSSLFLYSIAEHDPWDAIRRYDETRSSMVPGWGNEAMNSLAMGGWSDSADLTIAAITRNRECPERLGADGKFPQGFDFRKLADFLASPDANFNAVPMNLLKVWSDRDPAQSAAWLREHPQGIAAAGWDDSFEPATTLTAIANSAAATRDQALATLAQAPPETRAKWWADLSISQPVLSPQLLDAATAMGQRDAYLVASLQNTRTGDTLPIAWAAVPPAERPGLLATVIDRWPVTTPLDLATRDAWLTRTRAQWTALPPLPAQK